MAVLGQTDPTAPTSSPGSSTTLPGSTSSQKQPGVTHANGSDLAHDLSGNDSGGPDASALRDKIFLRKAGEGGLAEVKLGHLAAEKASNDEVKKFGEKMVEDHTKLNDAMKPVARELGVLAPTKMNKADQAEYDKLSALSGADFDKEYLSYMVQDHRKDLKDFRDESEATNDAELKDAAANGLKVIAQHTHMVIVLAKANGVTLPPRGK